VSTRVAKKIMDLEFVEMAEIVAEEDFLPNCLANSPRPPITNTSQWVEQFSVMVAIMTFKYPKILQSSWPIRH